MRSTSPYYANPNFNSHHPLFSPKINAPKRKQNKGSGAN